MGWVTCLAYGCRTRAGQVQRVFPDDEVSSAAPWLRSRHAPIWKGEKRQCDHTHARVQGEGGRGPGMRLSAFGYLGSLAGLSHLRDSDIGHGAWGWMGVSLPRCEPVEANI